MPHTTELRIVYMFDDGGESDLAVGTIDRQGMITIDRMAEDQKERVDLMVRELNEAERVFAVDLSSEGMEEGSALIKRPVYRGMPDFLDTMVAFARRHYRADLRFDAAGLEGSDGLSGAAGPAAEPEPADYVGDESVGETTADVSAYLAEDE